MEIVEIMQIMVGEVEKITGFVVDVERTLCLTVKLTCAKRHAMCAVGHTYFQLVPIVISCVPRGTLIELVARGMGL